MTDAQSRGTLVNLMRAARAAADITQQEAADGAPVPRITLARFEKNAGDVSAHQLARLLTLYATRGVRIDILAGTVQITPTT